MLKCIKVVLEDYEDIFPLVRMGHEFIIDLEDNMPPIHRPLYKLNLLELEEAHEQIQYMLEHGLIRPSDSLYGATVLFLHQRKTLAFSSALTTVG